VIDRAPQRVKERREAVEVGRVKGRDAAFHLEPSAV
jgi:hypothetical protein